MEKKLKEALKKFRLLTEVKKKNFSEVKADLSGPLEDTPQKKLFIDTINILEEIEENVNTCCAITMEPDEVLVLIDKLKSYINEQ